MALLLDCVREVDNRNLSDFTDYQQDRIDALRRHIETLENDIEYLHRALLDREAIIETLRSEPS